MADSNLDPEPDPRDSPDYAGRQRARYGRDT